MTQLARDLRLSRRQALVLLGGAAGAGAFAGCDGAGAQGPWSEQMRERGSGVGGRFGERGYADVSGRAADGTPCIAFPSETEGPFAADEDRPRQSVGNVLALRGIERGDIRTSFAGLTGAAGGVPLDLEIALVDVDHRCAPLAGRPVYLWHCDALGRYSLYEVPGQNYLRGLQVSDARGIVRFRTIYPACYPGRFPHIHLEVFAGRAQAARGSDSVLTSQFALPDDASRAVYRSAPAYRASIATAAAVTIESDGVFGDNSPAQRTAQTLVLRGDPGSGYRALGRIGLTASYRQG